MKRGRTYLLHAAAWMVLLFSPLMYLDHDNTLTVGRYLYFIVNPVMIIIVFYINYIWLTPRYYAEGKRNSHILINLIIILILGVLLREWMDYGRELFRPEGPNSPKPSAGPPHENSIWMSVFFTLRDMFNMVIAAIVATALCLANRWQKTELARQEAEKERTKAELNNLRSQINPHFLLNTLNNIYALTTIDPVRAQDAVLELSKMLRHMLYDNQKPYVNLADEITFLENYISLMKIRLTDNVRVTSDFSIPNPCHIYVAPMIFISLVENAFKHGTSSSHPCFISIRIEADEEKIVCDVENSNFPKSGIDRSGHGIGLQQVASRLELQYHGRYKWTSGVNKDKTNYKSTIIIYDTKLRHN